MRLETLATSVAASLTDQDSEVVLEKVIGVVNQVYLDSAVSESGSCVKLASIL